MSLTPSRPQDVLADGQDTVSLNGISARKGSVAAFLKNIELIESPDASEQDKAQALQIMQELAPVLVALKLPQHVIFKNPIAQVLLEGEAQKQS